MKVNIKQEMRVVVFNLIPVSERYAVPKRSTDLSSN